MTNLITEARELLSKAKTYLDATDGSRLGHLLSDGYDARYAELVCFTVAHLAELCDALEKSEREIKRLRRFKEYLDELYGQGLEIANWHLNGETEPFDNFCDSAVEWMDESLPAPPEEGAEHDED